MWKFKEFRKIKKVLKRKNKIGRLALSNFETYDKALITRIIQYVIGVKRDTSLGQHRESRNQHVWPANLFMTKESNIYPEEWILFSVNCVEKTG